MSLLQTTLQSDMLCRAWENVAQNDGIPGADAVSIQRWRRNWEERLVNLQRSVRANTYKPARLRIRRIPKRQPGEYRVLRIPTVTDRVLQRAVADVLQPIYEQLFLDCSFGYRPRLSVLKAVQRILLHRANDRTHVLDADIDAFFDSVDHALLLRFLQSDLPDDSLLPLISAWLNRSQKRGLPMGSPLSPLLANVFLHRFDTRVVERGYHLVRYADDFIILEESRQQVERARAEVEDILESLLLVAEPRKTRLTSFEEGFDFLGVRFDADSYTFTWREKQVDVEGDRVNLWFDDYMPEYE